jgi:hypothetical protein
MDADAADIESNEFPDATQTTCEHEDMFRQERSLMNLVRDEQHGFVFLLPNPQQFGLPARY